MNGYKVLMYEYQDSELIDSLEDSDIMKISSASIFEEYAQKFLTTSGYSLLVEQEDLILEGVTGDSLNIMIEKIQKYFPIEIDSFQIEELAKRCIMFHKHVMKLQDIISRKYPGIITEERLKKIMKSIASNVFSLINFEPTYNQIMSFYYLLKELGYQGKLLSK